MMAGSPAPVWTAYCDGASRGNPGPASFGVLVCDPSGKVVKETNAFLGINTNQVAEYEGLIRALEELKVLNAPQVQIFTDSEFVTKQFSGAYKVRDERMKVLMSRVRALQSQFESVQVIHIRRSSHPHNKRVDQLANDALDKAVKKG